MLLATALASVVLPTPGTSSIRAWPRASRQMTARPTCSSLPTRTLLMLPISASPSALARSRASAFKAGVFAAPPPGSAALALATIGHPPGSADLLLDPPGGVTAQGREEQLGNVGGKDAVDGHRTKPEGAGDARQVQPGEEADQEADHDV